jgi:cytochrome c-type biogenesis protein CcmH
MTRVALLWALVAALAAHAPAATTATATAAAAAAPRASLVDVEDEVMCTTCDVPLNVANSPQADRERALIRTLIARGLDKPQIKDALVSQYGEDVLALPDSGGFGLTAYAIPLGLLALLAGGLALLLPRWRRRSPTGIGHGAAAILSEGDARRLDDDLVRYD